MSQIGRKPIDIPEGVEVNNDGNNISVTGKLGVLNSQFNKKLKITISENNIIISRPSDDKKYKELRIKPFQQVKE